MSYNRKNPLLNTTDEEFQHYDNNNTGNYSDSEAINRRKRENKINFNDISWNKKLNALRNPNTNQTSQQGYQRINDIDAENYTDDDDDDDFNNNNLNTTTNLNNIKALESGKFVKTGRQRKKLAARSKGKIITLCICFYICICLYTLYIFNIILFIHIHIHS